ncbi:MAG: tRNA pseudouridine32 synthase/23S rRNA pseudouridine746 synthase [Psychrosphaera sp.]|jgi:tRNA pseudouridine32 synthase/23S rRNA pseudouridine746 synthase
MQPQADPFIVPKCTDQIAIIYQDESLLIINKPSGLLSLSGKHPLNKDSVHWRLVQHFPTALMVHRLDFGTSGLMVVALNKEINKLICEQFSQRTVTKYYEAILDGELLTETGEINIPVIKDVDNFPLQKVCKQTGKQATSQYQVVSYNSENNTTKVEFKPVTGRTHQLRIHSREIGHPIIGCDLYDLEQSFFKADRLMLHASRLVFTHPITNEVMDVKLPASF